MGIEITESKENEYLAALMPILDFLTVENLPQKSDVIFVFGSTKHYVASHAAKLYLKGYAHYILISGHKSKRSNNLYKKTEADFMKEEIIKLKVPEEKIITERNASNTLENVIFGVKTLAAQNIKINSAILLAKQFHLKRCAATFKKQFPNVKLCCSYPKMTFTEYLSYEMTDNEKSKISRTKNDVIKRIIGEIDRFKIYAEKGDIIKQNIPKKIIIAANEILNRL